MYLGSSVIITMSIMSHNFTIVHGAYNAMILETLGGATYKLSYRFDQILYIIYTALPLMVHVTIEMESSYAFYRH